MSTPLSILLILRVFSSSPLSTLFCLPLPPLLSFIHTISILPFQNFKLLHYKSLYQTTLLERYYLGLYMCTFQSYMNLIFPESIPNLHLPSSNPKFQADLNNYLFFLSSLRIPKNKSFKGNKMWTESFLCLQYPKRKR